MARAIWSSPWRGEDSYATGILFPSLLFCNSTAPTESAQVEILIMSNFPLVGNFSAGAFQAPSFMLDKASSCSLLQLPS